VHIESVYGLSQTEPQHLGLAGIQAQPVVVVVVVVAVIVVVAVVVVVGCGESFMGRAL